MTYSNNLKKFHSPSLYDTEYPEVHGYFENFNNKLLCINKWAGNGSLIAGIIK